MRFPMNTYKGEGTSWGKLNVIASQIWFLFFKKRFPFSHMLPLFQVNFIFVENTSSRNYFGTTVTFSGQLFLQNICCFPGVSVQFLMVDETNSMVGYHLIAEGHSLRSGGRVSPQQIQGSTLIITIILILMISSLACVAFSFVDNCPLLTIATC